MLQTLRNRRSRKGFTLAELLIVVAIIAVLVAIAVPLFVGALNDAETRVGEAGCRAVRGVAVAEILLHTDKYDDASGKLVGEWYAHATIDHSGEVKELKVGLYTSLATDGSSWGVKTIPTEAKDGIGIVGETGAYKKVDGGYEVLVKISKLEVTTA